MRFEHQRIEDHRHPARAMAFGDLIAGLEKARGAGLVSRKTCPETGLVLYGCTQRCVYDHGWDAFTLLARGLIVCPYRCTVIATPFPKFFNLGERHAVVPDLPFEAFEKLDGSLIIVFYDDGKWRAATKGAFDSPQALWAQARLDAMSTWRLTPGTTYLFEAIYPENVIVVRYPDAGLTLLAAYGADGREMPFDMLGMVGVLMDVPVARRHPFTSLADMVSQASVLPGNREGFVVRFADGSRLKIKGDEYKRLHALISRCTPLSVWDAMVAGLDLKEMRRDLPEEFWSNFDSIVSVLQGKQLRLLVSVMAVAEEVASLSDKELGQQLNWLPSDVRPFLFAYRKAVTPESDRKLRVGLLKAIRPTGNALDGYVPSYAMHRALEEAA